LFPVITYKIINSTVISMRPRPDMPSVTEIQRDVLSGNTIYCLSHNAPAGDDSLLQISITNPVTGAIVSRDVFDVSSSPTHMGMFRLEPRNATSASMPTYELYDMMLPVHSEGLGLELDSYIVTRHTPDRDVKEESVRLPSSQVRIHHTAEGMPDWLVVWEDSVLGGAQSVFDLQHIGWTGYTRLNPDQRFGSSSIVGPIFVNRRESEVEDRDGLVTGHGEVMFYTAG
jgi:hypothetical protein